MTNRTVEEQRWLQAIESASFGVWDLDPRLETVHYSPGWKARLGFPRIHAPDSTGFWRCRVHPEDFDPMLRALRRHVDGHAAGYEMRFRLRSNGSGYRTVLSRGRVVARDGRGDATRMIGTMVDLSHRPATPPLRDPVREHPPRHAPATGRPFHLLLGAPRRHAAGAGAADRTPADGRPADDAGRLVGLVGDLLDMAWRETCAAPLRTGVR